MVVVAVVPVLAMTVGVIVVAAAAVVGIMIIINHEAHVHQRVWGAPDSLLLSACSCFSSDLRFRGDW